MQESDLRQMVVKTLRPLHAKSVENVLGVGTPDVNYIEGWLELKYLRSWPERADTIVRVPKFSPQQRAWLLQRRQLGGTAHVLIRIEDDWLLLDGAAAARQLGFLNRLDTIRYAERVWSHYPKQALLEHLSVRPKA